MENSALTANAPTNNSPSETTEAKITSLLNCTDKRYEEELRSRLNREELNTYDEMLHRQLGELNAQQDLLMYKISRVTNIPNGELIRESNQRKIHSAMHRLLNKNGQMPSKSQIAQATGLSRKTVSKHMAQNANSSDMLNELAMMAPHVMNSVLQKALNEHDIHAARLYMKVTGDMLQQQATKPNCISIDTTVVSQADIDAMSKEQRAKLLLLINKKPEADSIAP